MVLTTIRGKKSISPSGDYSHYDHVGGLVRFIIIIK